MEIYFDNAATTRVDDEVIDLMNTIMRDDYGNPSSLHLKGLNAEHYIKDAADIFCDILKCKKDEIIFTSGGTESNNQAIIGAALANKRMGMHVISSSVEHSSVSKTMKFLEELGYEVTYLGVDETGRISVEELKNALRPDTILVSVMAVNNELGTIEPVKEIGELVKENNPATVYHVDGIQAFTKLPIIPKNCNIDLYSLSSHKFHGPKGVGALYIKKGTKMKVLSFGGGQQRGFRSGTHNVPGIAGMALAAKKACQAMTERMDKIRSLKEKVISGIKERGLEGVYVNGGEYTSPHVCSISVEGVGAEVLLHTLENDHIYVSAGSACSSNEPAISATLKAISLRDDLLKSTVRLSFCYMNDEDQVEAFLNCLEKNLPILRKYRAR